MTEDVPYDPPPVSIRGRSIVIRRELIEKKPADQEWLHSLCPDQRRCVEAWFNKDAESHG